MNPKLISEWPKAGPGPRAGKALVLDPKRGWVVAEVKGWGWATVPGAWAVHPTHFVDLPPQPST